MRNIFFVKKLLTNYKDYDKISVPLEKGFYLCERSYVDKSPFWWLKIAFNLYERGEKNANKNHISMY